MTARTGVLCLLILWAGAMNASAQDTPLAVLMARQGEVQIARGGDVLPGEFGMHLGPGDEIRTGEQSRADILYASGQTLQLGANGSLILQGGGDAPSSPATLASVDRLLQLRESRGTSAIGRVRGGSSAEIIAVSPRASARIRADRPVFRWSGGDDAGEYEITLEHEGEVLWVGKVYGSTEVQYPADAPQLMAGEPYSWRVHTVDPLALSEAESQTAFFETLSADQSTAVDEAVEKIGQLDLSEATRTVLTASVLFESGLVDEAIKSVEHAIENGAGDESLRVVRDNLRAAYWP